ncbi:hypothetical protein [Mesorhizobium sp. WSM4311]|uniref:hypothetical protein n=1 Tax=Mesorhizobium sp. WSM4311 TaxID=2029410 RepID=UPI0015CD08E4|nr:hypothetical protein [Mesorhizobium sp. WSM4311]
MADFYSWGHAPASKTDGFGMSHEVDALHISGHEYNAMDGCDSANRAQAETDFRKRQASDLTVAHRGLLEQAGYCFRRATLIVRGGSAGRVLIGRVA